MPTSTTGRRAYKAYLLRLWQSDGAEQPAWRASLEDSHTGERLGFASLPLLYAFLEAQTGPDKNNSTTEAD